MLGGVYQIMFNNLEVKHLADNNILPQVYINHQVNIIGKC